jgi:hypothetical protein
MTIPLLGVAGEGKDQLVDGQRVSRAKPRLGAFGRTAAGQPLGGQAAIAFVAGRCAVDPEVMVVPVESDDGLTGWLVEPVLRRSSWLQRHARYPKFV